jgi:CubicO group peptidase (beta-lactamase class C family)
MVLVEVPDQGFWTEAFGVSDLRTGRPMSVQNRMRIGDITKTFTGSAILQLVDRGLIGLDDPVARYQPDVPNGDHITIRQVMNMTSGLFNTIEDVGLNTALDANPTRTWLPEEVLEIAYAHPPYFAPGQGWHYSHTDYDILGQIVQRVSGIALPETATRAWPAGRTTATGGRRAPGRGAPGSVRISMSPSKGAGHGMPEGHLRVRMTAPRRQVHRNLQRRSRSLVLTAVATLVGLLAALLPVAASAAPTRYDNKTNIIVFVHGINENRNTDCASTWKNAMDELIARGFTGPFRTYGYYDGDTHCDATYRGDLNTSLDTLAKDLAGYIASLNLRYNQKVDVVAHSMGGLILRRALTGVQRNEAGYPNNVWVEDAVTISTPHGGAVQLGCEHVAADPGTQCRQMEQGTAFMKYLHTYGRNPQSDIGTDWSIIYSHDDPVSCQPPNGDIEDIDAGHKYAYDAKYASGFHCKVKSIHGDLIQFRNGDNDGTWGITWQHAESGRKGHNPKGESPLHLMANALFYWRTW